MQRSASAPHVDAEASPKASSSNSSRGSVEMMNAPAIDDDEGIESVLRHGANEEMKHGAPSDDDEEEEDDNEHPSRIRESMLVPPTASMVAGVDMRRLEEAKRREKAEIMESERMQRRTSQREQALAEKQEAEAVSESDEEDDPDADVTKDDDPEVQLRRALVWLDQLSLYRGGGDTSTTNLSASPTAAGAAGPSMGWLFEPNGSFRTGWDVIIVALLTYLVIYLPYRIAFVPYSRTVMDSVVDAFFILDILVQFNTAVEKQDGTGGRIVNRRDIARHYIRGGTFFVDVIAAFPLDLVLPGAGARTTNATKISRLFRLTRVTKLARISHLQRLLKSLYIRAGLQKPETEHLLYDDVDLGLTTYLHPRSYRLMSIFVLLFVFLHFTACAWYFVAEVEDVEDSWYVRVWSETNTVEDLRDLQSYLVSVYFVSTVVLTIGFGDISPRTSWEIVFVLLLELCGVLFFSTIMASIGTILSSTDRARSRYRSKLGTLFMYLESRGEHMSAQLRSVVMRHMTMVWRKEMRRQRPEEASELIEEIPAPLRYRMATDMFRNLIQKSLLLSSVRHNTGFFIGLSEAAEVVEFREGEIMAPRGFEIERVYFIESGTVHALSSLYKSDTHLLSIDSEGACVGQVGLLAEQQGVWYGFIRAASRIRAWVVSLAELRTLLVQHGCFAQALAIAKVQWREVVRELKEAEKKNRRTFERSDEIMHRQVVAEHNDVVAKAEQAEYEKQHEEEKQKEQKQQQQQTQQETRGRKQGGGGFMNLLHRFRKTRSQTDTPSETTTNDNVHRAATDKRAGTTDRGHRPPRARRAVSQSYVMKLAAERKGMSPSGANSDVTGATTASSHADSSKKKRQRRAALEALRAGDTDKHKQPPPDAGDGDDSKRLHDRLSTIEMTLHALVDHIRSSGSSKTLDAAVETP